MLRPPPASGLGVRFSQVDEKQTRLELIDPALRKAGWKLDEPSQVTQELSIMLAGEVADSSELDVPDDGTITDYALKLSGIAAAVVEAKRTSKDSRVGQEQALKYAQALQRRDDGPLPFVFYTNGNNHWFWESESYPPAKIYGFPTADDLAWLAERRRQKRPLPSSRRRDDRRGARPDSLGDVRPRRLADLVARHPLPRHRPAGESSAPLRAGGIGATSLRSSAGTRSRAARPRARRGLPTSQPPRDRPRRSGSRFR